jgi:RNA methyltransferase, TrmH family
MMVNGDRSMSITIGSSQNPKIRFAVSLQKASVRKKEKLFLVEGLREIRLAMIAGFQFHTLFVCRQIIEGTGAKAIIDDLTGQVQIIETTDRIFSNLAYREGSDGLLAVVHQKYNSFSDISFRGTPLILVVESIEKPGNLGAILRTADAGGVDAVLVCDGRTDIFNPNVVRSSLGSIFTNKVITCSSQDAIKWLKDMNIRIYTTALTASRPYHQIDYTLPSAIVTGSEATGVRSVWEDNSDSNIIIPMSGKVDSMNVSVATSIVLYEALRQRNFPGAKFP